MKWFNKKIENLLSLFLRILFGTGNSFGRRYGISSDNQISINSLPSPMPRLHDFYDLVAEKLIFEVVSTDVKNNLVYISEVGSETIYPINAELFIILFVRNETKYNIDKLK